MKISVLGLGYVGCVTAACLAKEGHQVIGVDINASKVDMINQGKSPIVEKDIDKIIADITRPKDNKTVNLIATTDAIRAVIDTEITLICVGTPSNENGSIRLEYVQRCAADIGKGIKQKNGYHVAIVRSTIMPGSTEAVIIREIEYTSGKRVGKDFGVVMNPEFLRESSSVYDFYNPPVTVIGEYDSKSGDSVQQMYHFVKASVVRTEIKTAEMIKYANNTFHALKVCFANEIGTTCKTMGIDSHKVMEIFCMDNKLNLSPYYLKPGFAFGGSCLPKDTSAIIYKAKEKDIYVPVLHAIIESNKAHLERTINTIISLRKKNIGILGLSFKAGTDDLRESPLVNLTETLIGKGYSIKIYDKNVSIARLYGANKEYIEKEIPHISSLMTNKIDDILTHADILIIGHKDKEFEDIIKKAGNQKIILDLVRIFDNLNDVPEGYEGICW